MRSLVYLSFFSAFCLGDLIKLLYELNENRTDSYLEKVELSLDEGKLIGYQTTAKVFAGKKWSFAAIFRQKCRNIGVLNLRLSFGKLPTLKLFVFWAIFRQTAEIYDSGTEAIFRQRPTDLFAYNEAIFRQAAEKYERPIFGYLSASKKNASFSRFLAPDVNRNVA